jgi:hypothetical protein
MARYPCVILSFLLAQVSKLGLAHLPGVLSANQTQTIIETERILAQKGLRNAFLRLITAVFAVSPWFARNLTTSRRKECQLIEDYFSNLFSTSQAELSGAKDLLLSIPRPIVETEGKG